MNSFHAQPFVIYFLECPLDFECTAEKFTSALKQQSALETKLIAYSTCYTSTAAVLPQISYDELIYNYE